MEVELAFGNRNNCCRSCKRLNGFGVEIWGYNTNGREVEYFDRCFGKNQINEIFKNCDVVVSTMPCTEKYNRND